MAWKMVEETVHDWERIDRLRALADGIGRCRRCPLSRHRTRAVAGEGPPDARMVLVGEAPGAREDQTGRPFVGPAGRFLDRLLAEQGFRRSDIFLTSCVKCRPPGNRTPHRQELTTCTSTWLLPQLRLIAPAVTVLCGRTAVAALLGGPFRLADHHGTFRRQGDMTYFITYHPAAAMRFAETAAAMQADLALLAARMGR
ncbi:MAG TPA: uracil-DNA glycosylase [Desulfobulbus sp.]|nr:uracil-DNA glycosylase [Desulfobulbus sp.]